MLFRCCQHREDSDVGVGVAWDEARAIGGSVRACEVAVCRWCCCHQRGEVDRGDGCLARANADEFVGWVAKQRDN